MVNFPTSIVNFLQLQDGVDRIIALHPNSRGDEITATQTMMGAMGRGQAYNENYKNFLRSYKKGCDIEYKSVDDLYVRKGELGIPDGSGHVTFRRNTAEITVDWSMLDTGIEASATTYYIYAVADSSGTTFTILISANPTTPTGATYYRLLGTIYNNGGSDIVLVNSNQCEVQSKEKPKAWVQFDGATPATIEASFNVTSVTDNGVGDFTANLTNKINPTAIGMASVGNPGAGSYGKLAEVYEILEDSFSILTTQIGAGPDTTMGAVDYIRTRGIIF